MAVVARADTGLDVLVNLRPPHIAASEFLRAHDTAVRTVKLVQDIPLQAGWNDDACTPQKTSLVWSELGVSMVVRPVVSAGAEVAGLDSLIHCSQGRVTASFSADLLGSHRQWIKLWHVTRFNGVAVRVGFCGRTVDGQARQSVGIAMVTCLPEDNVILVSGEKESIPLQASGCHRRQIFDWAEDRPQRFTHSLWNVFKKTAVAYGADLLAFELNGEVVSGLPGHHSLENLVLSWARRVEGDDCLEIHVLLMFF